MKGEKKPIERIPMDKKATKNPLSKRFKLVRVRTDHKHKVEYPMRPVQRLQRDCRVKLSRTTCMPPRNILLFLRQQQHIQRNTYKYIHEPIRKHTHE